MSYDLSVSIPVWPSDVQDRWLEELRLLGIDIELLEGATLRSAAGWLPLAVRVRPTSMVPHAARFRALDRFESGFELHAGDDHASFSAKPPEGNAVAVWCAAALASVTRGGVRDPQAGIQVAATRAIEVLSKLFRNAHFARSFSGPATMPPLPPLSPADLEVAPPPGDADPTKPIRDYAASARFEVDDRVRHPTFGEGSVETSEPGKVTIRFPGGRRVLAQSKEGALTTTLSKPAAIDHSLPTPGAKRVR